MLKDYLDPTLLETLQKFEDEGLAVFFSYSGHIDNISVFITLKKHYSQYIYYKSCFTKDEIEGVVESLEKLSKSKKWYYNVFDEFGNSKARNLKKKPRAKKGVTVVKSAYKILPD